MGIKFSYSETLEKFTFYQKLCPKITFYLFGELFTLSFGKVL